MQRSFSKSINLSNTISSKISNISSQKTDSRLEYKTSISSNYENYLLENRSSSSIERTRSELLELGFKTNSAGQFFQQQVADSAKLLSNTACSGSTSMDSTPFLQHSADFGFESSGCVAQTPLLFSDMPELNDNLICSSLIADSDFLPTPYIDDNLAMNSSVYVYGPVAPLRDSSNLPSEFYLDPSNFLDPSEVFKTPKLDDVSTCKNPSCNAPNISDLILMLGDAYSGFDNTYSSRAPSAAEIPDKSSYFSKLADVLFESNQPFQSAFTSELNSPADLNLNFNVNAKESPAGFDKCQQGISNGFGLPCLLSSERHDSFTPLNELQHSDTQDTRDLMSLFVCSSSDSQNSFKAAGVSSDSVNSTTNLQRTKSKRSIDFQSIFKTRSSSSNLNAIAEEPSEGCCSSSGCINPAPQSLLSPLGSSIPTLDHNMRSDSNSSATVSFAEYLQNRTLSKNILEANSFVKGGNYVCRICNKSFGRKYNLKTHIQTHPPFKIISKKYSCPICNKAFTRRHDMKRHHNLHNKK